jgi:multiple sugar transport system permease protein
MGNELMNPNEFYPKELLTERRFKILFVWPSLIVLLFLIGYPFIMLIFYSFFRFSFLRPAAGLNFIGLENYQFLLTDKYTWDRFIFTGKFVIMAVILQFFVGVGSAYLLQEKFRGRGVILTLVLMPMMLCPIVVGLFWKYMFNTQWGIINYLLKILFNVGPIEWLANEHNSIYAAVIADTWMWAPFMTLLSLAAFTAIPRYLYEAASVDRASAWFKFRHITLPLSAPILVLALLFRLIDSIKQFDLIYTLTAGGPGDATQTISFTLYKIAFQYFYTGQGSALAMILLITIICLSTFLIMYMTRLIQKQRK